MVHRQSPSGPFLTSNRLRWYGEDANTNPLEQTGSYARAEAEFDNNVDPILARDEAHHAHPGRYDSR